MKTMFRTALILVVTVLLLPGSALASGYESELADKYVWGESYILEEGETLDEDLYIFGGTVVLEEGSTVTGDIWLYGGNLTVDGEVEGDVQATAGNIEIGETALIHGELEVTGGTVDRDPDAVIEGGIQERLRGSIQIDPGPFRSPLGAMSVFDPISRILGVFMWSFVFAAAAVILVSFFPRQVDLTARTASTQPLISGGLGILTVIVLVVMMITIILIPVSILGLIAAALLGAFGWIAIGTELGRRLMTAFRTEWALPVSAGLGTLLLTLVAAGINAVVDCIGWTVPAIVGAIGLGAVLLTRLGTQPYPPPPPQSPLAPVEPRQEDIGGQ